MYLTNVRMSATPELNVESDILVDPPAKIRSRAFSPRPEIWVFDFFYWNDIHFDYSFVLFAFDLFEMELIDFFKLFISMFWLLGSSQNSGALPVHGFGK